MQIRTFRVAQPQVGLQHRFDGDQPVQEIEAELSVLLEHPPLQREEERGLAVGGVDEQLAYEASPSPLPSNQVGEREHAVVRHQRTATVPCQVDHSGPRPHTEELVAPVIHKRAFVQVGMNVIERLKKVEHLGRRCRSGHLDGVSQLCRRHGAPYKLGYGGARRHSKPCAAALVE